MKRWLLSLLFAFLLAGGAGAALLYGRGGGEPVRYRLAPVERGPLSATVSTTGSVNAVITVQVGSQVSGQISGIFVDFNSPVKRGQLIATLDPELFAARVNQARSQLQAAQAAVMNQRALIDRSRADVATARASVAAANAQTAKARVHIAEARRELDRKNELFAKALIARAERDAAQTAHDVGVAQLEATEAQAQAQIEAVRSAEAQVQVAHAQLENALAQVSDREAALWQAKADLERTRILAPVDGVVVSRNVDVGQVVAASLQAPTLFTIAQDLSRMRVDTNVDEADIGRVRLRQRATFTLDSFPNRTFAGEVVQIRKAPQVLQNVVTYNVVIAVHNTEFRLLPGMTANVRIVVDEKPSVLKIQSAALRFQPPGADADAPSVRGVDGGGARPGTRASATPRAWVLAADGKPVPVPLQVGITDGQFTEVINGVLTERDQVIVGAIGYPGGRSSWWSDRMNLRGL